MTYVQERVQTAPTPTSGTTPADPAVAAGVGDGDKEVGSTVVVPETDGLEHRALRQIQTAVPGFTPLALFIHFVGRDDFLVPILALCPWLLSLPKGIDAVCFVCISGRDTDTGALEIGIEIAAWLTK